MRLRIRFRQPAEERSFPISEHAIEGVISIGSMQESFLSPIGYWSRSDYEASWGENHARILRRRNAYFATDISEPQSAALFIVWPVVWLDGAAHITQKLVLRDRATTEFVPDRMDDLIDYEDLKAELPQISSWVI